MVSYTTPPPPPPPPILLPPPPPPPTASTSALRAEDVVNVPLPVNVNILYPLLDDAANVPVAEGAVNPLFNCKLVPIPHILPVVLPPIADATGSSLTVTVLVAVAVQLAASVTVTVYVPAALTV